MKSITLKPKGPLKGELHSIATDKSISHRCVIFSLLSNKTSKIKGYLQAQDTLNSLKIARTLGLQVKEKDSWLYCTPPKKGIKEPNKILDCGNAGTALRLYCGLLSGARGHFVLNGDRYLKKRPMGRVVNPLRQIGACIFGRDNGNLAPISIQGSKLKGFNYTSPIPSAQIKSAMILAALQADKVSFYGETEKSRDHSEKMLCAMGAKIMSQPSNPLCLKISPLTQPLDPLEIEIPSDPSSAFFFAVAAAITPGSEILLKNVLLNPTRIEAFKLLQQMGATIQFIPTSSSYEEVGDIYVKYSELHAIQITDNLSWIIDEIPALAIAMATAKGVSRVQNAYELRVKECDRIEAITRNIAACGIKINGLQDGFEIEGGEFQTCVVDSFGDHRIAMSFALVGLLKPITIKNSHVFAISFPKFLDLMQSYCHIEG